MSQDLMVAWCPNPGPNFDPRAAVQRLSDEVLRSAYAEVYGEPPFEDDDEEDWRENVRVGMVTAFNRLRSGDVMVNDLDIDGTPIYVAGGTSWGETPETPEGYDECVLASYLFFPTDDRWRALAKVRQAVAQVERDGNVATEVDYLVEISRACLTAVADIAANDIAANDPQDVQHP